MATANPTGRPKVTEPMMDEDLVVALMKSSTCEADWNINCDAVKHDHGGKYPDFWWRAIVQSGLMDETRADW